MCRPTEEETNNSTMRNVVIAGAGPAGLLLMALLLRTLDSLMIYTEAFAINAGGPDGATAFLSLELGEEIAAFNYGPAAARSVLYFLIVLTVAWVFRLQMQKEQSEQGEPQ